MMVCSEHTNEQVVNCWKHCVQEISHYVLSRLHVTLTPLPWPLYLDPTLLHFAIFRSGVKQHISPGSGVKFVAISLLRNHPWFYCSWHQGKSQDCIAVFARWQFHTNKQLDIFMISVLQQTSTLISWVDSSVIPTNQHFAILSR